MDKLSPEDLLEWRKAVRAQNDAAADFLKAEGHLKIAQAHVKRLQSRFTEEYQLAQGDQLNERTGQIERKKEGA